ncbi:ABC transporter ATP-binding protein [Neomicrococcus lactis]|uniref:ATP-binding cassette subfamily B protein n=1 Tax=Neomicrococcus lactis TaxID=732241 RepID=A0A7W8YD67_9MICC|nr:ABC transporter ATP-binding protein [Neomicrococcus lactis]MBB5599202.1 ATP-binding cassette subfamily B protein [Neomicrococcus lactis]
MDHNLQTSPAGNGAGSGNSGGGRGAGRIKPADKNQISRYPVSFSRVASLFSPHKVSIAVVILLITMSSAISLAQPFLVRGVIDDALPHQNVQLLVWLTLAMVGIAALTSVLGVFQTWRATVMGQRVMHALRVKLFTHMQKQSLGFFTRTRGGEVQSRLINDISGMQSVVTTTATGIASNVTTVVGTAIAMIALSPQLSLLSLIVLPPSIYLSRKVALLRRDITEEQQIEVAALHAQVEESLSVSGARLSKTLGTAPRDAANFAQRSESLVGLEVRSQLAGRWRMATMSIVFAAIPAAIYLVAGLPVTRDGMTIGTLVAFTGLQAAIFRPIMGLLNVGVQWVSAMAFFSRIFEYLDLTPDIPEPAKPVYADPETARGEVRFENVSFAYPRSKKGEASGKGQASGDSAEAYTLQGVNLVLTPGTTTAVIGATGSGKSTLGSLVPRLNEVTQGRLLIDGVDVRDISGQNLSSLVGVVSQETYLLHTSIRANLLLAKPDASEVELWEALTAARVADTVRGLPDGLDTVVGARGHRFSGGEQQRLAIARTILRNPRILILDEATSALDNSTEAEVQAAIDHLAVGRTTLTIAHRLSTIQNADVVVRLDGGRIVEQGSPAQVLAAA